MVYTQIYRHTFEKQAVDFGYTCIAAIGTIADVMPIIDENRMKIGDGVTNIPKGMFYGCTLLKTVIIGNNVTSIGDEAFFITGITSITIPNSVKNIGAFALYSFEIENIYYLGTAEEWSLINIDQSCMGDEAHYLTKITIHYDYVPQ